MARRHVAVALLVPPPAAGAIDVLRSALGASDVDQLAPHLTLVPPRSLRRDADLPAALAVLRAAAAATDALTLRLGPVASFTPLTPTVHLAVGNSGSDRGSDDGEGDDQLGLLARLQAAVEQPPLQRPRRHPFVPHVTLLEQAPLHRIRAACLALDGVHLTVDFRRLTLLAEQRDERSGRRAWQPLADVDLGGVRTLGAGGLPIELARGTMLDPEAAAVLGLPPSPGHRHSRSDTPTDGGPAATPDDGKAARVVVARLGGDVVGAAWGPGPKERRVDGPIEADLLTAEWHRPRGSGGHGSVSR